MANAEVEATFMSRPPPAVKPERKVPEELFNSNRLPVALDAALMIRPRVLADAGLTVRRLLTRKVLFMVDEALTKIPTVVEVGVSEAALKVDSQAPFCPAAPEPQADPVPETKPFVSTLRHCVDPV